MADEATAGPVAGAGENKAPSGKAASDKAATESAGAGKYRRPPTIGDRRRLRGANAELEMLGNLGAQAQGILRFALTVEGDEDLRNFNDYLAFRGKISEFEAFCSVIESHLKDVVSERRQELEDRFYSLWSMIFRPTLRALTRFFDRLVDEQVLPLGGRDLLEAELRQLQGMRSVLTAPRFTGVADQAVLEELKNLETTISKLAEHATSLPDLSKTPALVADAERPADVHAEAPPIPGPAPAGVPRPEAAAVLGDMPNVKAVHELKALLEYYKRDKTLRQYVDIDTRAVDEIERKLVVNPMDPAAIVWMRQICNAWASRLRDNDKEIRRVLAMIRSN
ncbi:MAG: hypothetical protein JO128_10820 [Alphaproteobacteria bacterium]|nr:hypothetical protein [Alphaproteobacteria bacterium]